MKPKITKKDIFPIIRLKPEYYKETNDFCALVFKKTYIEIRVIIDSIGNTFKLKYEDLDNVIK